jgi:hypothetical protein
MMCSSSVIGTPECTLRGKTSVALKIDENSASCVKDRVDGLVSQMTLEEKISFSRDWQV